MGAGASATADLVGHGARTAAVSAAMITATKTKRAAHHALARARLYMSNNRCVVKVALPHTLPLFESFSLDNIIKAVEVLQRLVKDDLRRGPAQRLVAVQYTRSEEDEETGETVQVRVTNPGLECEQVLAALYEAKKLAVARSQYQAEVERAGALILANYDLLVRVKILFTQSLDIMAMRTLEPALPLDHRKVILKKFAQVNRSGSGVVDLSEIEKWTKSGCPGIGQSVFLPMVLSVVPTTRVELLTAQEWLYTVDRWCTMTEPEVLRYAFFNLATLGKGPGEYPRIVVSTLKSTFYEFKDAALTSNNINRPLLHELAHLSLAAKRVAHSGKGAGVRYLGDYPTYDLISFAQFKTIHKNSPLATHPLLYLHRFFRRKIVGLKYWDKRRQAVRFARRQQMLAAKQAEEAKYGPTVGSYSINPDEAGGDSVSAAGTGSPQQPASASSSTATPAAGTGKLLPWAEDTRGHSPINVPDNGDAKGEEVLAEPEPDSSTAIGMLKQFQGMSMVGLMDGEEESEEAKRKARKKAKKEKKKRRKQGSSRHVNPAAHSPVDMPPQQQYQQPPVMHAGIGVGAALGAGPAQQQQAAGGYAVGGGYSIAATGLGGVAVAPAATDVTVAPIGTALGGAPLYASSSAVPASPGFGAELAPAGPPRRIKRAGVLPPMAAMELPGMKVKKKKKSKKKKKKHRHTHTHEARYAPGEGGGELGAGYAGYE